MRHIKSQRVYQRVCVSGEAWLAGIGLHTDHQDVSGYYLGSSLGAEHRDVGLAWQECTRISLRDSVLWWAVIGLDAVQFWIIFSDMPMVLYRHGEMSSFQ